MSTKIYSRFSQKLQLILSSFISLMNIVKHDIKIFTFMLGYFHFSQCIHPLDTFMYF